ncbi:OLC1v1030990C1 [Oldenlandia corymbosa var. corymbosa]|uniref:OLC1v1030990C1 n=1 Tax=Oldenlandia corymbosa var. corymbosa TaxID=529605 RepID=A0AAV1CKD8_OLDCO|nr:OLC1v1030990C1 [Oldenlandia corymbosa var. corymbosa]
MNQGNDLVRECNQIRWWDFHKMDVFCKRIKEYNKIMSKFSRDIMIAVAVRDCKLTRLELNNFREEVNNKLDLVISRQSASTAADHHHASTKKKLKHTSR